MPNTYAMEATDDSDNNSTCSSTSSTDSDSSSMLSVVLNNSQTQENGPETFTYAAPLPVGSYALASCVYVLIDKGRSMSADMRVMWYLKRLGTIQMVDDDLDVESPEQCKIMSFIPREENLDKDGFANSIFVMDAFTRVYFLTAIYNMVYCLDMSPSNCSVDIQRCHVMLDEMTVALRRSIKGFIRPFIVPGSDKIVFEPQVYVTVIVHTPFYTSPAQQVLVQGWLINNRNFQEFIRTITTEMNHLENSLAMTKRTTRKPKHLIDEIQTNDTSESSDTSESDDSNTNYHHNLNNSDSNVRPTFNNNPDSGFINTLRYGMLAVRLLPQTSISNLIVITDGMITLADIQVLDSVLNQLRCISVACSFLHVSSQFHPHSGHGNVPYSELMQLIATATSGTYLNSFPKTTLNLVVNFYHDKFIMWSFKRGDGDESPNNTTNLSCTPPRVRHGEWTVRNSNFYGNRQTQLVSKKQFSDHIQANLDNIVCCRLREGFIIEDIQYKDAGSSTVVPYMNNSSKLQLKLILPWTNHIYIEYDITVKWPPSIKKKIEPIIIEKKPELVEPSTPTTQPPASIQLDSLNIYYTVSVKGPYEFLHDITCTGTKKSQLLSKIPRQCQFQLSSCRSSSISVATATTTITRNLNLLPEKSYSSIEKRVTSKYRQALIARFWLTMRSIAQTDLLVKHLEAYSPSTGHLVNPDNCNQPLEQNEIIQDQQLQKQESRQTVEIEPLLQVIQNIQVLETTEILQLDDSSNLNSNNPKTDTVFSTEKAEANPLSFLASEVPNKSPLHNGVPLFYYLATNSNTSYSLKQNQFKTDDQQQSYTDQQHQRFADFWKPVCTLDPDTQWPKWFSTYRIGGGVLLLRHDRPLPQWFHKENTDNDSYQTLTCTKSSVSLFNLLKQWCTFVLIDEHSYVKCLDQSETYTDDVSFCIARVSPRPPSCCCVVLHLAFQSCVPASVHHKIIDDLKNNIELLDSTTTVKPSSSEDNNQGTEDQENRRKTTETIIIEELLKPNKPSMHKKYVYLMDKPLEKILIRYERIPSEFTTVIFPDGSQPSSAMTTINLQKPRSKLNIGPPLNTVHESLTEGESKAVSTTTTLSRYLYHKRWIWSSECSRYSQCSNSVCQKLQLQLLLARTLSVLTRIRLREGFKFAHSSAGIINMVLQVDMIEGSLHCPSTPTSHCVIQYVLFPPNKLQKQQQKTYEYNSVFDQLNDDHERSSILSIDEQQKFEKRQKQGKHIVSFAGDSNDCCLKHRTEDEYQLITECWIEPQHGTVVVNKTQNYNYMSGLMYEQLADALWQVDSDCIGSLFTFQHMQHMCMNQNILVSNPDIDINKKRRQSKTVIIDAGRIYKLPFTFNLVNLLPKCRHYSSITFSLFTADHDDTELNSARDEKKLNYILERSFYSRLRTYNNRSFDVNDSDISVDMNQTVNDQEIGQCFIKRVNDTRLILTVGPSLIEEKCNTSDNLSEDNLPPFGRSRANTWHYTKRGIGQSLLSAQSQENSTPYYRTMSVGSKPYFKDSEDMSWAQLRLEQNFSTPEIKHNSCLSDIGTDGQDYPTHMFIDVYDCRQEDVENVLMSGNSSFDHSLTDDYLEESSSCSSTETDSDEYVEEKNIISNRDQIIYDDPPVDPMFLEKYLCKIRVIYDRSLVTTVFQALHLGLNVRYMDIQRAVDRCQHRLISFDITDYIKVVCDHFKKNADPCSICPADNTTLKSHHDMIHSKFSATLDRHMLKPVANHQDYYFYDLIDDLDCDEYTNNSRRQKYLTNILLGETYHKTDFDTHELDEQDIFPLFVHLVCTVKTNTVTKSQSVRSLPTCILELLNHDNDNETSKNMDFSDLKVSLDVYCLMLPINVYDDDDDDDDDEIDKYTTMNSSEQLHFPINNKSTILQSSKQTNDYENSFVHLSASLPPRHAQGLAEFLAEVEWCMRDEMAAGLLQYPTVTTNSLEKIIEHVSNSPKSPSNDHEQIPVHFVVPSSRPFKNNSVSLFLQKLDQLDIILDSDNGHDRYALEQSTKDTFYVVEKNLHLSPDSTVFENNSDDLENSPGSDGFLTDIDRSKPILPNFWIILRIQPDLQCQKEHKSDNNNTVNTLLVNVYFHCRFSELNIQGKYSAIMEIVKQNVHQAATVVNQTILLCRLYETKTCDPLLEPIIEDHDHSDDAEVLDENGICEEKKVINHFTLGQFKCPVVWSTRFSLHPRLQRATAMGLLGVQVLHTMLEGFSVRNRRNMFVYKESSGSVFYLRIYENSSQQQLEQKNNNIVIYSLQYDSDDDDTMSRCSSATSTTIASTIFSNQSNFSRKYSEDVNYMDNKSIQNPGTRSLGGYWGDVDSKDVEDLTLKVHGISPVGDEIRIDLVRVLQNRLNDGVLELLTTMLYRNPLCRLYPDDVRFIQPSNGHPDYTMKLSLPIETKITKLFTHNLKRNAATLLLYPPQYASRHHRFNYTYSMINETKKPIIRSFFMYNQPIAGTSVIGGKRITSGKRGLACVLFDIYSNEDQDSIDDLYDYPTDPELFERRIQAACIDDFKSTTEFSGYINLFVWWRGRDNMEVLQQKLTSTVTYSLWDIYIERFLWDQPLIIEQPSEIYVNPLCIQFLTKWLAFGARKSVPLAYHSKILCRIHISHVLREFKTHLSWSWLSSSNLPISVRYFYVPRTKYGETSFDCVSNNIISGSTDPLQLQKKHDSSLNNLMFYEWQVPDTDSVVCPPSAACVLIVVSITSTKNKQKRKRYQNLNMDNEHSDSDVDNGFVIPQNHENINTEEVNIETLTTDDQPMILINDTDENVIQNPVTDSKKYQKPQKINDTDENVIQSTVTVSDSKKYQKPQKISIFGKITKLFLLAVSGQSVHALSYNCHRNKNGGQPIAIQHLSRWLEWRNIAFTSSIYHMIGLRNSKIYGQFGSTQIKSHSSRINNNLELLLDYKNYISIVGEYEPYEKIFIDKNFRINNRGSTKPLDNDAEEKKNKPLNYRKDVQDSYIERLVRNSKHRRRTEMYQKLLYDMWIQVDNVVTKEAFRTFYQQSRLIHYCLTPLLFLPWWRLESAATRDHLVDASKLKTLVFSHAPQWHKRLCARLTVAYAQYIETDPLFSGFQPIQIGKSRVYNDGMITDLDCTKAITRYYKKTIPGVSGGLLLIEIGVCQPFYYIKLSCIERARITNLVENYKDKYEPCCILEQSENIIQNMHLHSFTYDFHVRILSDRLSKLVEKQKAGKRCNYGNDILMLLDHKNSIQNSANKTGNNNKKNVIAGFLDDFLKYYTLPPLYSNCLVLAGVIKRSEISVTGLQLYEYLVENCSEDCEGMAVLKIGDSSSTDGDDGASLFDDLEDHEFLDSQHIFGNDLTDYILVHRMAGSDIQRRQELANNSNNRKLGVESNEYFTDNQYEVCGLFDATLVMTLSSVKQLLLDTSNEITLSYYVLLTNNENYNLKKKKAVSLKTVYNMQQRHSTPIRPPDRRFDQSNNVLLSASVPSNSVGNSMTSGSATCGGSLDENNAFQNWSQLPPNHLPYLKKKCKKNNEYVYDDLNEHHQQTIKKRNLIKFYEKKAAELVAHTVDTAANRCRIHLLWKLFGVPIDQQKIGITDVTFNQLEELVNTSVFVKSLPEYDQNYSHILKLLLKQPQWFTSLHKMISEQSTLLLETTSTLPPQCRIYNSNRSEHQYIVVLPNLTEFDEFDAFVIIDNGIDSSEKLVSTSDSLVNVVFRRNVSGSDEVATLVEAVGDSICYLIWQTIK